MVKRLLFLLILSLLWQPAHAQRESAELKALRSAVAELDSSDTQGRALALKDLGVALKDVGRYKPALVVFNESALLNRANTDSMDLAIELALLRAKVLTPLRDYPGALAWIEHAHRLERMLLQQSMNEHLLEQEARFETRLQDEATQRQELESQMKVEELRAKELQLYGGVAIALLALITLVALLLVWRGRSRKTESSALPEPTKNVIVEEKEQIVDVGPLSHTDVLHTDMDPHFIHSSLTAIASMLRKNEAVRASAYLDGFLRWLRMLVDHSGKEQVPLEDGIAFLRQYLKMEALRFPNGLDYSVEADPALLQADSKVLVNPMLLQPFVESAIRERLASKEGAKRISVHFSMREEKLIGTVEDNGMFPVIPKESDHPEGSESTEQRFTKQRLQLLSHKLGNKRITYWELKEGERSAGTRVEVLLVEA